MPPGLGVYRMLDAKGDALHVGKARALKKRVTAYTQPVRLDERIVLRDNKSYPWLMLTEDHPYPQIAPSPAG